MFLDPLPPLVFLDLLALPVCLKCFWIYFLFLCVSHVSGSTSSSNISAVFLDLLPLPMSHVFLDLLALPMFLPCFWIYFLFLCLTCFWIYFLFLCVSHVSGSTSSSCVLDAVTDQSVTDENNKTDIPEDQLIYCGAADCGLNVSSNSTTTRPAQKLVWTLVGSYIGVGVVAILIIIVFLDNIDREQASEFRGSDEPFGRTFLATFRLLKDWRLVTLIPLTMYSGFEQSFLSGEYTKNYVTCALGIHYVGFVMMCFGATNSLCSFIFGRLARYTGRAALFFLAALTNFGCIIALLLWRPHPDELAVFFVFPALWGMADAVWQTQTNALYGVLFSADKEAAFANYRMWESLGFVIAFAYSTFLCLETKLYILLAVLLLTAVTYPIVEYHAYKNPAPDAKEAFLTQGDAVQTEDKVIICQTKV